MSLTAPPELMKGGLVALDDATGPVKRTIALQYHPHTRSRPPQQTDFRARITSAMLSVVVNQCG
jgi:hypothetical protein